MYLPKLVIKAIDKWRRGFLWKGQEQQNGVNYLVASEKVLRLLQYGGHTVHNLESLGWALHIRGFGHKKPMHLDLGQDCQSRCHKMA